MTTVTADAPLAHFLVRSGHPLPHLAIPLKGELPLPGGGAAPAWLCATERDALLVATVGELGAIVDLGRLPPAPAGEAGGTASGLRYQRGTLADALHVHGQSYAVPLGKGDAARKAIAAARLRAAAPFPDHAPPTLGGPWVDAATDLEAQWLAGALPAGEAVLAWIATAEIHTFPDSIGGPGVTAPVRLLLTPERACLVAVSDLGDPFTRELPLLPLDVSAHRLSRDTASVGEVSWRLPRGGAERLRPLARLTALRGPPRLREAARLLAPRSGPDALRLLRTLSSASPLDRLSQDLLLPQRERDDAEATEALAALIALDSDGGRLADWLRDWGLSRDDCRRLLALAFQALPPERADWALPVHRHILDLHRSAQEPLPLLAAIELEFAAHLLLAGRKAEATSILELRRAQLPDEELQAVLPPPDADLTSGQGGQPLHLQALELLATARGTPDAPDPRALAELARHQPLVLPRLQALAPHAPRAQQALQALLPGGLQHSSSSSTSSALPPQKPWTAAQIERLRHPVARESGALGRLQAALARVTPPDQGTLRDYCERVSPRKHPDVIAAVTDACVLLGMPAVPVYLSMGSRRVGVRSHEKPEPFLLLGGAHIDPEEDVFLQPAELRAALGAELAHLRFQHSRVTSDDLWAGLWDTGSAAFEASALVLPVLKYLPADFIGRETTSRLVSRVLPLDWLQRLSALGDTSAITDNLGRLFLPSTTAAAPLAHGDVGLDANRVLAAHRAMQLTADRAALLLSGDDLAATLRTPFLLHSRLLPELAIAERIGLHAALARRGPDGRLLLPDLAVRTAALVAFLLSDDHRALSITTEDPGIS